MKYTPVSFATFALLVQNLFTDDQKFDLRNVAKACLTCSDI